MTEEEPLIPPQATMVHEPYGFVAPTSITAHDLVVVNAARVSYKRRSDTLTEGDEKLIRYLLAHKHGTPFEHNFFCFHIRAPIFVLREWHRHRIGWSYNEESARYVELQPHFYLPDEDHCRNQDPYVHSITKIEVITSRRSLRRAYNFSFVEYKALLDLGVAREIARSCLPVATYSQMYASCNARSLMHFLTLRNADAAMREIKDYAEVLEKIFAAAMPVTHRAFIDNGRVAP